MNKIKTIFIAMVLFFLALPILGRAEEFYYQAKILRTLESELIKIDNEDSYYQKIEIELDNGQREIIEHGKENIVQEKNKFNDGDKIIVYNNGNNVYQVVDRWRIDGYWYILFFFLLIVIYFVGLRGLAAVFGLFYSLLVIFLIMVPMLLHGFNPILTTVISGLAIVIPTTFITHGFRRQSVLISASIIGGLLSALVLNLIFTYLTRLTGAGSEETYYLQIAGFGNVDFKALFMGGVIVGVLGVLDDVAVGQISVVNEIREVDAKISNVELTMRSLRVGKAHVLSLVNTLALAYIGAALPLFMLFVGDKSMPWWVLLNSEGIGEEIIRTLVGSSALILTVPIATLLAVWFRDKKSSHR